MRTAPGRVVRRGRVLLPVLALATVLGLAGLPGPAASAASGGDDLYLVTLDGPGTAGRPHLLPTALTQLAMLGQQEAVLDAVGAPVPVARWTTALNGVAVRLTSEQATALRSEPGVALVERSSVRTLAGRAAAGPTVALGHAVGDRGAGVVVGLVDSGIDPDGPLFADVPSLRAAPARFAGACVTGDGWDEESCNRKIVAARWFVAGFGADRVRSASSLSARDDDGHGTQMASIAAGNAHIAARVGGQRLGSVSGVAPDAQIAVYKACWTAPDPDDDGCSSVDLVSAIDAATRDRVDVLNLSVGGPAGFDTVERALLGAAEAGIVVVAAAGNGGHRSYAAHAGPWVTTVGASTAAARRGRVRLGSGPALTGAMSATRPAGPARLVVGARVPAPGASAAAARVCAPGSLDAARVSGTIVLCERGVVGRVDKSAAVRRADGVGMVLANVGPGTLDADVHSVPTVHVDAAAGRALRSWLGRHPGGKVTLRPLGVESQRPRVPSWSSAGDPSGAVLKPDLVAPAVGLLGAIPPDVHGDRWDVVSGTSAGAAYTSGAAARLLARRGWTASMVRSALATTTTRVAGGTVLDSGAGRVRPGREPSPLVYDVPTGDYRAWLEGTLGHDLNTPSVVLHGRESTARRTITNAGRRTLYFSSHVGGFVRHAVSVRPAAVRLHPGESATFTVHVAGGAGIRPLDDGFVLWHGADGSRTRIPVLLIR